MKKTEEYLKILDEYEPAAVRFLPNVLWAHAEGYHVTDNDDVTRIDFCAGAMIANSGHNCPDIIKGIKAQLDTGIYTTYLFPNIPRCELLLKLSKLVPSGYQIALMNTGSEAMESAIKISRIYATKELNNKGLVISFKNSYHGKMMATTAIGGVDAMKYWIPHKVIDEITIQVPFPTCPYESREYQFTDTLQLLKGIEQDIAAFVIEPYQGGTCAFLTPAYAQELRAWCDKNRILLISDEVQSGMGRTGRLWAYEHLGIVPDVIAAGKGLSAALPLSAVIARKDLFDLCELGSFNTTHSGNPICCAAAVANIDYMINNEVVQNAEEMGQLLNKALTTIQQENPWFIKYILGKGLAQAIHLHPQFKHLSRPLVDQCIKNGLLLISPGGPAGTTIKIIPPLIIDEKGIKEGCAIIAKSVKEIIKENNLSENS